ncbi:putative membrane protein YphA (DoxX/SURF4 family) [Breoghania corrubedonensis]|uniref:Putative membrane protein YphA (DoxX/SURF4 family) n=1 Tax=Breoghania corrubedonensis TaxID=665038 RepID=A0A2T5UW59_9HYPH|nr:DoxX family protein [Breoghania corrubedonensis]PTW55691.1 putative membrane protein YphA (DoxX/SURF4 family) [Breoghania corrubedonensis]
MNTHALKPILRGGRGGRVVRAVALLALCSAYLQGALTKSFDLAGAAAEMAHFGLHPPGPIAIAVIGFELSMCVLVLSGVFRWLGALALGAFTLAATFLAFRFWMLPPGMDRAMATNGFFEHLGLVGAFLLVALQDLRRGKTSPD